MARICIDIIKLGIKDQVGFYEVNTNDDGGAHFYISIDNINKLVNVYLNKEFQEPILTINTTKEQKINSFENISASILLRVVWRCMQTYNLKEFPDSLSFCS